MAVLLGKSWRAGHAVEAVADLRAACRGKEVISRRMVEVLLEKAAAPVTEDVQAATRSPSDLKIGGNALVSYLSEIACDWLLSCLLRSAAAMYQLESLDLSTIVRFVEEKSTSAIGLISAAMQQRGSEVDQIFAWDGVPGVRQVVEDTVTRLVGQPESTLEFYMMLCLVGVMSRAQIRTAQQQLAELQKCLVEEDGCALLAKPDSSASGLVITAAVPESISEAGFDYSLVELRRFQRLIDPTGVGTVYQLSHLLEEMEYSPSRVSLRRWRFYLQREYLTEHAVETPIGRALAADPERFRGLGRSLKPSQLAVLTGTSAADCELFLSILGDQALGAIVPALYMRRVLLEGSLGTSLDQLFRMFDRDLSGTRDAAELRSCLLALGSWLVDQLDWLVANQVEILVEVLKGAFRNLDDDASGGLDLGEFRRLICELTKESVVKLSPSEVDLLFHADRDGDGEINVDEFVGGIRAWLADDSEVSKTTDLDLNLGKTLAYASISCVV
ncbi:hypothetical protein FOL47_011267 [Perkinsus chesapeaki]|uniref:EF-hand domain-containing protein n=1 Tax=Perkinsus chesapeaki TaxID=330153 RepID=A0A7J6KXN8_PERCH|nr:hypothetical protein FOL47_011267 [Perkinsus chesapeaki]